MPAKPLQFNSLSLDTNDYEPAQKIDDSDTRLMEMLAAQAAHRDDGSDIEDEDAVAANNALTDEKKKEILQKALNMAASNGDVCGPQTASTACRKRIFVLLVVLTWNF